MESTEAGQEIESTLCAPLGRVLTRVERERVHAHVRALLLWQRRLRGWPARVRAPDATPFVSIYADGVLRGCFGSVEGPPGERLTRAVLRALEDSRYGTVRPAERGRLAAVVSYPRALRAIDPERVHEELAAGTEGLGAVHVTRGAVVLVPHVARDLHASPRTLLRHLAKKAGLDDWSGARVFAMPTEDVVVRVDEATLPAHGESAGESREAAATWLGRLIDPDGAVMFAIDARQRRAFPTGVMHHGRAAVVVRALAEHAQRSQGPERARLSRLVRRARAWLERALAAASAGVAVPGWPEDPAMVAGTYALMQMAGVDARPALEAMSARSEVASSPWHAAQVVAALGRSAPEALWRACLRDLEARPWAPWTLVAARERGDAAAVERVAPAVAASIRTAPPHEGGCMAAEVPEIAVTSLVVEALDGLASAEARQAVARARRFIGASQLLPGRVPASLDPSLACGAFPMSPVMADVLRCDVVAHALLALSGSPTAPSVTGT